MPTDNSPKKNNPYVETILRKYSMFEKKEAKNTIIHTGDVEILPPGSENGVTIVHHVVTTKGVMHAILEQGLKSRKHLASEGKLPLITGSWDPFDYDSNIYFRPPLRPQRSSEPSFIEEYREYRCEWVAIDVNPQNTYVYNGNYRAERKMSDYYASRRSLQDLLDHPVPPGSWEVIIKTDSIDPKWFSATSHQFKYEHRHDSEEDQRRFDKALGLIRI